MCRRATTGAAAMTRSGFIVRLLWAVAILAIATVGAIYQPPRSEFDRDFEWRDLITPEGLFYPIEINKTRSLTKVWGLRHPLHWMSADMSPDGRRAWIVGSNGALLRTVDGGLHWRKLEAPSDLVLYSIQMLADGRGWIGGSRGTILRTRNGEDWEVLSPPEANSRDINSVFFLPDGRTGWAAGDGGLILKTTDGGEKWTRQPMDVINNLWSVHFIGNGRLGWAVGDRGTLLATQNGGESWEERNVEGDDDLLQVRFASDGRRGWAVGARGTLHATENGGDTWTRRVFEHLRDRHLFSLHFDDDGRSGWIAGSRGAVLKTMDAGATWQTMTLPTRAEFGTVQFSRDGTKGLVAGSGGIAYRTQDSGRTWSPTIVGPTPNPRIRAIAFQGTSQVGWAVDGSGKIFRSDDRGETWRQVHQSRFAGFQSIAVAQSGQRIVALNVSGATSISGDGGRNWIDRNVENMAAVRGAAFDRSALNGIAIDVLDIFETRDGGATWSMFPRSDRRPTAVDVTLDGATAYVGTEGGQVLVRRGRGPWTPSLAVEGVALRGIHAHDDGRRAWAVGAEGAIAVTSDGGVTWTRRSSGTSENLLWVRFDGAGQAGWAGGSGGALLRSDDSGTTWRNIVGPSSFDLRDGWPHADGRNISIVTEAGSIWVGDMNGATWRRQFGSEAAPASTPDEIYRFIPAPWYWIFLVVLLYWITRGATLIGRTTRGIVSVSVSDQPVSRPAEDRLGANVLARGISLFLRNRGSRPPMTVAIGGAWGIGKSSVMRLLEDDLRQAGAPVVWFNAWHYQNDTFLLAALMEHIRSEGLPRAWTWEGFCFRANLIFHRCIKPILLIFLVAVGGLLGYVAMERFDSETHAMAIVSLQARWNTLAALLSSAAGSLLELVTLDKSKPEQKVLGWLAAVIGIPVTAFVAWQALAAAVKPFKPLWDITTAESTRALAAIRAAAAIPTMAADAGFRFRFARQFGEVTRALGRRRLILIVDDLDRCHPSQVAGVLETMNFLVNCGRCYVVLGLDREKVDAAIGLAFNDAAQECGHRSSDGDEAANRNFQWSNRRAYAKHYLDKLINLHIDVPVKDRYGELLVAHTTRPNLPESRHTRWRWSKRHRILDRVSAFLWPAKASPVDRGQLTSVREVMLRFLDSCVSVFSRISRVARALTFVVLVGAVGVAATIQFLALQGRISTSATGETPRATPSPVVSVTTALVAPQNSAASDASVRRQAPAPEKIEPDKLSAGQGPGVELLAPQSARHWDVWAKWQTMVLAALFAFLVFAIVRLGSVDDSSAFRSAFRSLSGELRGVMRTPRDAKALQNAARFRAMLLRAARPQISATEWLSMRWAGFKFRIARFCDPTVAAASNERAFDEGLLARLVIARVAAERLVGIEDWAAFEAKLRDLARLDDMLGEFARDDRRWSDLCQAFDDLSQLGEVSSADELRSAPAEASRGAEGSTTASASPS